LRCVQKIFQFEFLPILIHVMQDY